MTENQTGAVNIKADCSFPSQLDPFLKKKTPEWGLSLARAIESQWFYRDAGRQCNFYTSQSEMIQRRLYAKGIQPMGKYYEQLGASGDKSYLNLPKKPISIIPKLVAIVCNGLANRDYSVKASSVDPISQENKFEYRKQKENDMLAMPVLKKAQEELGVNVANSPIDEIPETKEELDLHISMEYKTSIELSAELSVQSVFTENRYKETTEKLNKKDLTVLGVAWAKHRFVPERGIVLEYVDPEYKIQSYSEDPYFRDCFYHGEFKPTLISDVLVEYPWINDPQYEKERKMLENSSSMWYTYHTISEQNRLKGTCNLLYFTYKTTRERVKKVVNEDSGAKTVKEGDYIIDPAAPKNDRIKFTSIVEEIEFEGVYVLGTEILLKWEVAENMIRPKSNKQKVVEQYIGVAPNREKSYIDSLVARMMPIDDEIQILRLKNCQMIQRMNPDGFFFDFDGFTDIDLGTGALTPQNLMDMLFQTGSTVGRSYSSDGGYNAAKIPISELRTVGNIEKINQLRLEREFNFNLLREVIGLNTASDASSPEKDSLVGIQKLAAANSNVATRDILYGGNDITLRLAWAAIYRVSDVLKYSDLKDDLVRKIGATAVLDLEEIKSLHLYDFAISLELELDDEERAKLEADLSVEISKGFIDTADKYKVLGIKNFKQAVQYLAILKKKNQKRQEEIKKREIDYQTQANLQSAKGAEEEKRLTAQLEGQVKSSVQQITNQGLIDKEKVKGDESRKTLDVKGEWDIKVAEINGNVSVDKQKQADDRKDERLDKQSTQQSRLIDQRSKDKQPVDFESENIGEDIFKL